MSEIDDGNQNPEINKAFISVPKVYTLEDFGINENDIPQANINSSSVLVNLFGKSAPLFEMHPFDKDNEALRFYNENSIQIESKDWRSLSRKHYLDLNEYEVCEKYLDGLLPSINDAIATGKDFLKNIKPKHSDEFQAFEIRQRLNDLNILSSLQSGYTKLATLLKKGLLNESESNILLNNAKIYLSKREIILKKNLSEAYSSTDAYRVYKDEFEMGKNNLLYPIIKASNQEDEFDLDEDFIDKNDDEDKTIVEKGVNVLPLLMSIPGVYITNLLESMLSNPENAVLEGYSEFATITAEMYEGFNSQVRFIFVTEMDQTISSVIFSREENNKRIQLNMKFDGENNLLRLKILEFESLYGSIISSKVIKLLNARGESIDKSGNVISSERENIEDQINEITLPFEIPDSDPDYVHELEKLKDSL